MKNSKGFTLIELVVAVAILGVITLISIPAVKTIQSNNRNAKYMAYEKSLKAASKAFVDSYDEDLFGATNSGCAKVFYSDLKDKDIIENIQMKGTDCSGKDTYIYVIKNHAGNHAYFSSIKCKQGDKVVYENKEESRTLCELEDGKGPVASLVDKSPYAGNPAYKRGQDPKIEVSITDSGVGLKENQTLSYEWFKEGKSVKTGDINFKNKNYASSASRGIANLPNMSSVTETTTYKIVVTGTVEDINNNPTEVKKELIIKYFVSKVIIRLNANGGQIKKESSASGSSTYAACKKNPHSAECRELERLCRINPTSPRCKKEETSVDCSPVSEVDLKCKERPNSVQCRELTRICRRNPNDPMCKKTKKDPRCVEEPASIYSLDAQGYVLRSGEKNLHVLKEYDRLPAGGLVDWNKKTELFLEKSGYSIRTGYEWNAQSNGKGKSFNQTDQYYASEFCTSPYEDCNVTLYLNWRPLLTATFIYQGAHAYFNGGAQTRSCLQIEDGGSCTVTAPGISNLPATAVSACGSPYSYLLIVQGWNANPSAGTGFSGNVSISSNVTYYSIITPNPAYVGRSSAFTVKAYTCNNNNNRNVVERSAPYEDYTYATCIKEKHHFTWDGGWAINGNYALTDKDDGAWFYLTGYGTSCRKIKGDHAATPCKYSYTKAFQLSW